MAKQPKEPSLGLVGRIKQMIAQLTEQQKTDTTGNFLDSASDFLNGAGTRARAAINELLSRLRKK